jgi:hypothetical protein
VPQDLLDRAGNERTIVGTKNLPKSMSLINWPPNSVPRMSVVRSSRAGSVRRRAANSIAYIAISIEPVLSASA